LVKKSSTPFKLRSNKINNIVKELRKASNTHTKQADRLAKQAKQQLKKQNELRSKK
tara:strand:- start:3739 stop:3906 length:168 start_codon:yes stop_codon:yes gene_type:complete